MEKKSWVIEGHFFSCKYDDMERKDILVLKKENIIIFINENFPDKKWLIN